MSNCTVDLFVFFMNDATPEDNIKRLEQDIFRANSSWNGCVQFILKGVFHSKRKRILNAAFIPANNVFKNRQIDSLIRSARQYVGYRTGIYIFYLNGDYFAEGRGKKVVGVSGTELVSFKNNRDYTLYGRILLTDMAAGRYTLAHELGHILFKRYDSGKDKFIHSDPSGPYIHSTTKRMDSAHNNSPNNLMFPITPTNNPTITIKQCKVAQQSKMLKLKDKH